MFHSKNTSNCCLMYVSSAIMDVTRKQSTPNFPKNEHFLSPNTQTYVCVPGRNMFVFQKIWRALFSCNTRFEIRSIALLLKVFSIDLSQLGVCEFLGNFEFFFRTNILHSISGYRFRSNFQLNSDLILGVVNPPY